MKTWIKVLLIVAVLGLIIGGTIGSVYNKLVMLDTQITSQWAQVENVLQRRNDLIPNLVETVKGYAKHEKGVFDDVANARAKLAGAKTMDDKIGAYSQLDGAISRLLVIAENYPQLKANESFEKLMDELSGTENRIAIERKKYNEIVQAYNIAVKSFPGNIIASMTGFKEKDVYFKAEEKAKEVPKVSF